MKSSGVWTIVGYAPDGSVHDTQYRKSARTAGAAARELRGDGFIVHVRPALERGDK